MRSKVFAAARGFFPLRERSIEQAWKELTGMFGPDDRTAKSYIVNGYPLECVKRDNLKAISVGDWFKYGIMSATYVEIVASTPPVYFAYDEVYNMPMSGRDIDKAPERDDRTRMEFFLRSHPEATLVEIRRRSKGGRTFGDASMDVQLLERILLGRITGRDEIVEGDVTIKRDDSLRIDF